MFELIAKGKIQDVIIQLHKLDDEARYNQLCTTDAQGDTLLHAAVRAKNLELAEVLLAYDIERETKNKAQLTAGMLAQQLDDKPIAQLLQTRQQWLGQCGAMKFHTILTQLLNYAQSIPKKDQYPQKVLLIGRSGAGKSTWVNYAQGTRYERTRNEVGIYKLKVSGGAAPVAKVGTSLISQTLFPQLIKQPKEAWSYCDLAGFDDNRGVETRVIAASSAQSILNQGGSIKAIFVVLDLESFLPRGEAFRETMKALGKITNQWQSDAMTQVYFLVTQAAATVTPVGVLRDYVNPILNGQDGLNRLTRPLSDEERNLRDGLRFMLQHPERIFIPNVSDNGESVEKLFTALRAGTSRECKLYSFLNHDADQVKFYQTIARIALAYNETKNQLNEILPNQIKDENQIKESHEKNEAEFNEKLRSLEGRESKMKTDFQQALNKIYSDIANIEEQYRSGCHPNRDFLYFLCPGYAQLLAKKNEMLHPHRLNLVQLEADKKVEQAKTDQERNELEAKLTSVQNDLATSKQKITQLNHIVEQRKLELTVNHDFFVSIAQLADWLGLVEPNVKQFLLDFKLHLFTYVEASLTLSQAGLLRFFPPCPTNPVTQAGNNTQLSSTF